VYGIIYFTRGADAHRKKMQSLATFIGSLQIFYTVYRLISLFSSCHGIPFTIPAVKFLNKFAVIFCSPTIMTIESKIHLLPLCHGDPLTIPAIPFLKRFPFISGFPPPFLTLFVRYHSGGSMKLNAYNLLLAHMVYL
jgi:hypothetical protein